MMDEISVHYVIYDSSGKITQFGKMPRKFLSLHGENILEVDTEVSSDTGYVEDSKIKLYSDSELVSKKSVKNGWVWKLPECVIEDIRNIEDVKSTLWEKVKAERIEVENSPLEFNGDLYDSNLTKISAAAQSALIYKSQNLPFKIFWTLYDNTEIAFGGDDIISLFSALSSRNENIFNTAKEIRTEINAATSIEVLDSMQWTLK